MPRRALVLLTLLGALASAALPAGASAAGSCGTPFVWAANHHQYEGVCKANVTWPQAVAGAKKAGGHLVTLGSAAENHYVFRHINFAQIWRPNGQGQSAGPWIGLIQAPASTEPDGGWGWITGEPLTYTDWTPSEPNNYLVQENRGAYWNVGHGNTPKWDDIAGAPKLGYTNGYVIEWDKAPKK